MEKRMSRIGTHLMNYSVSMVLIGSFTYLSTLIYGGLWGVFLIIYSVMMTLAGFSGIGTKKQRCLKRAFYFRMQMLIFVGIELLDISTIYYDKVERKTRSSGLLSEFIFKLVYLIYLSIGLLIAQKYMKTLRKYTLTLEKTEKESVLVHRESSDDSGTKSHGYAASDDKNDI